MKLPQLSLRDLFWLVLTAALLTAWRLDHHRSAKQIEELTKQPEIHISPIPGGYFPDLNAWWPERSH
jgi:hypothetical protein